MSSPDSSSSQRRANRARVVRALRERGAQSRRTLAEIGLSRSTVTSVVEELIDAGTVTEVAGSRDARGTGRPPTLVGLKGTLGVAVGVEVANGVVRAAVCNTAQELLLHDSVPMDDHTPPEATLKTVGALVGHMLDRLGLARGRRARRRRRDARPDPAPQRSQRPRHHAQAVGQRQPARRRGRGAPHAARRRQRRQLRRARRDHLGRRPRPARRRVRLHRLRHRGRLHPRRRPLRGRERHGRRARPHHDRRERPGLRVRRPRLPQHPRQRRLDHARTCGAATATGCPSAT